MTDKEIEEVLEELNGVRPEMLNGEAKRLFNAIMKIADERDELKKIEEIHRELNGELREELQLKDKMIDEMIIALANNHCSIEDIVAEQICDDRCVGNNNWSCKKCIKEYFTKKASENNE